MKNIIIRGIVSFFISYIFLRLVMYIVTGIYVDFGEYDTEIIFISTSFIVAVMISVATYIKNVLKK